MNLTEKRIIEKGIQLFKEKGYEETSINTICAECNITKGTFYYHFNAKSDLIFCFFEYIYGNMMSIMPNIIVLKDTKEKIWKLYEYSIDYTIALGPSLLKTMMIIDAQNGFHYFSPLKAKNITTHHQVQTNLIKELIIEAQKEGSIHVDKNPELLIDAFSSVLSTLSLDWSSSYGSYDLKTKAKELFDVIFI